MAATSPFDDRHSQFIEILQARAADLLTEERTRGLLLQLHPEWSEPGSPEFPEEFGRLLHLAATGFMADVAEARIREIRPDWYDEATLSEHQSLWTLLAGGVPNGRDVKFAHETDEDTGEYVMLDLPRDVYDDMGRPSTLTVSVVPGDRLNDD